MTGIRLEDLKPGLRFQIVSRTWQGGRYDMMTGEIRRVVQWSDGTPKVHVIFDESGECYGITDLSILDYE
jgi:hypothetical protein